MPSRIRNAGVFIVLGLALFFGSVRLHDATGHTPFIAANGSDFREFFCAGEAVLHRVDPYRVEPLRSCIRRVEPRHDPVWLVTPAPLPGYALALSAAFAKLPFAVAKIAWETMLVASLLIATVALARLTRWSPLLILILLIPTDGFLNLAYGELPPIVIAALCVGALALERGAIILPALCAGVALIEPHLGLPALVALFAAVPRARIWTAAVACSVAVVSLAAIGLQANLEYFRFVLPLQAVAEVVANDQYSLTRVLAELGASPAIAIAVGSASYVGMVVVGVVLAVRLGHSRRLAYVLLVPPAAVALGGSYIHDIQIVAALPLALLLASDVPEVRPWALGAAILLLLPATSHRLVEYPAPAIAALIAMVVLGSLLAAGRSLRTRVAIAGAGAVIVGIVGLWLWSAPRHVHAIANAAPSGAVAIPAPPIQANEYAPVVWGAYLRASPETSVATLRFIVEKVPAWAALTILIGCAIGASRVAPDRNSADTAERPRNRAQGADLAPS